MNKLHVIQIGTYPLVHSDHAAKALRGLPETYVLEAIVEDDPVQRERAAHREEYAGLPFIGWEAAVNLRPDAFIIETEEHLLVPNAIRALEAGFHVYMDKPGGEDSEEFHRLCKIAAGKKLVLCLGYMFRENPAVRYALELKRSGQLGEIFSVEGQMSCCTEVCYRNALKRFRGGMMHYLGCHMIDLVASFCGFPEETIPLNASTLFDAVNCLDAGFCAYRYKNGVSFVKTNAVEVNGATRRSLIVTGSKGSFEIRPMETPRGDGFDDTFARLTLLGGNPWKDCSKAVVFPPHKRYDGLFLKFASYIRKEAINPYTYEYEEKLHDLILSSCRIPLAPELK